MWLVLDMPMRFECLCVVKPPGTYLTVLAIANKLGGSQFAIARTQAVSYARMCTKLGGIFCKYNHWIDAPMFLYVERHSAVHICTPCVSYMRR